MSKTLTILLVDDSATNLAIMFDFLVEQGHRVLLAENGEIAIKRCKAGKPDIVFMDIMMPVIDGFECCRLIKADEELCDIPVLFLSAKDDRMSRTECYKSGGIAYLTKPVIFDEVRVILDNQIELLKLRKERQLNERNEVGSSDEFDVIIEFIAHDMKTPIGCVTGFAEELSEQFVEAEVSDEWNEYIGFIHKSAHDIDIILEALVMLKNLRLKEFSDHESASLVKVFEEVTSRYDQLAYLRHLETKLSLNNFVVLAQPALLKELIVILFRNFSNLVEEGCPLRMTADAERTNDGNILLRLATNTRPMETAELSNILEPLQGKRRSRVKDTNILLLCAQKLITHLAIKAWAEHGVGDTLNVCLIFKPGNE